MFVVGVVSVLGGIKSAVSFVRRDAWPWISSQFGQVPDVLWLGVGAISVGLTLWVVARRATFARSVGTRGLALLGAAGVLALATAPGDNLLDSAHHRGKPDQTSSTKTPGKKPRGDSPRHKPPPTKESSGRNVGRVQEISLSAPSGSSDAGNGCGCADTAANTISADSSSDSGSENWPSNATDSTDTSVADDPQTTDPVNANVSTVDASTSANAASSSVSVGPGGVNVISNTSTGSSSSSSISCSSVTVNGVLVSGSATC